MGNITLNNKGKRNKNKNKNNNVDDCKDTDTDADTDTDSHNRADQFFDEKLTLLITAYFHFGQNETHDGTTDTTDAHKHPDADIDADVEADTDADTNAETDAETETETDAHSGMKLRTTIFSFLPKDLIWIISLYLLEDLVVEQSKYCILESGIEYRFSNIHLLPFSTLTVNAWDWNQKRGGILCINCRGSIIIEKGACINLNGKGYKGNVNYTESKQYQKFAKKLTYDERFQYAHMKKKIKSETHALFLKSMAKANKRMARTKMKTTKKKTTTTKTKTKTKKTAALAHALSFNFKKRTLQKKLSASAVPVVADDVAVVNADTITTNIGNGNGNGIGNGIRNGIGNGNEVDLSSNFNLFAWTQYSLKMGDGNVGGNGGGCIRLKCDTLRMDNGGNIMACGNKAKLLEFYGFGGQIQIDVHSLFDVVGAKNKIWACSLQRKRKTADMADTDTDTNQVGSIAIHCSAASHGTLEQLLQQHKEKSELHAIATQNVYHSKQYRGLFCPQPSIVVKYASVSTETQL